MSKKKKREKRSKPEGKSPLCYLSHFNILFEMVMYWCSHTFLGRIFYFYFPCYHFCLSQSDPDWWTPKTSAVPGAHSQPSACWSREGVWGPGPWGPGPLVGPGRRCEHACCCSDLHVTSSGNWRMIYQQLTWSEGRANRWTLLATTLHNPVNRGPADLTPAFINTNCSTGGAPVGQQGF